eukprot:gnl/Hemi2/15117_TR5102_c1_g1_i1.p1 gnl/Hemi2/15117_TR5102_c1_g1~~gnl/Hemi2/15117_TR5102_c1_g1_i1.p1  ORF type:complete len:262 (+),score=92.77 gnl/Hemi2/15117_TR5102_c1_g1_i1:94-786(+)
MSATAIQQIFHEAVRSGHKRITITVQQNAPAPRTIQDDNSHTISVEFDGASSTVLGKRPRDEEAQECTATAPTKKGKGGKAKASADGEEPAKKKQRKTKPLDSAATFQKYGERIQVERSPEEFESLGGCYLSDFRLHDMSRDDVPYKSHVFVLADILAKKGIAIAGITSETKKDGKWVQPLPGGLARDTEGGTAKVVYCGAANPLRTPRYEQSKWSVTKVDKVYVKEASE